MYFITSGTCETRINASLNVICDYTLSTVAIDRLFISGRGTFLMTAVAQLSESANKRDRTFVTISANYIRIHGVSCNFGDRSY